MNKIDEAWQALQKLPPEEQEQMAEAILDFAAREHRHVLTDEQVAEIRKRLADPNPEYVTLDDVRARLLDR